jgi:iron complex outermembrane receptor protein
MTDWKNRRAAAAALALLASMPAQAQRTDDNAVTQADDAFGKSVGDQSIGIYNAFDVRGFSPSDAGNIRIEGLYFDQQGNLSQRVQEGSTVRVGISAQGYPFPAPTGIADYSLRKPGSTFLTSAAVTIGPFGSKIFDVDVKIPLDGDRLGVAAGITPYRIVNPDYTSPDGLSTALLLRWAPRPGVEIMPFIARIREVDNEASPLIFTNGAFLPNRIDRTKFFGQSWNDSALTVWNAGIVARANPWGFDVQLGVFRSILDSDTSTADLLFDTDTTGRVGRRVIIRDTGSRYASTSGELRVSRHFDEGPRRHTLIASLRGRDQTRRFGGAGVVDLGASQIGVVDERPEPTFIQGAKTLDSITQTTFGVAYQGRWRGVGEISLGAQKTRYRKATVDPDPAIVTPATDDSPWLFSATGALNVTKSIALYAGYTRGLEESPVAPQNAVNLNEAPPAIRTEQKDAGIRWTISPGVNFVVGVFDIAKPYFNLDPANRFRQLGMVRHRGVELSLAGQIAPGLSLVAGNVMLDAKVSGEDVDRGVIAKRPVGTFVRHTIISLDYRLPWHDPLSFDATFEGTSDRTANAANTLIIPTRAVMSLGARYRLKMAGKPILVRALVGNVTNTFGWNVGESGFFTPNGARRFSFSVAADI